MVLICSHIQTRTLNIASTYDDTDIDLGAVYPINVIKLYYGRYEDYLHSSENNITCVYAWSIDGKKYVEETIDISVRTTHNILNKTILARYLVLWNHKPHRRREICYFGYDSGLEQELTNLQQQL